MKLKSNCAERDCKWIIGMLIRDPLKQEPTDIIDFCEAFPDGIPDDINYGDNKHTEHYSGDHGIRYEKEQ